MRTLPDEQLSGILLGSRWLEFDRDEVVSRQATPVDTIVFVASGRARAEVLPPNQGAVKVVLDVLSPGNDIGLLALVDGAPHSATVVALEPMRAVAVDMETMRVFLQAHPEWYKVLAEVAVHRMRTSGVWLQALI